MTLNHWFAVLSALLGLLAMLRVARRARGKVAAWGWLLVGIVFAVTTIWTDFHFHH